MWMQVESRNWDQITLAVIGSQHWIVRSQASYYSHVITPPFKDVYSFYHFELGYGRWYTDVLLGRIYE